jgi:hypothetical protein
MIMKGPKTPPIGPPKRLIITSPTTMTTSIMIPANRERVLPGRTLIVALSPPLPTRSVTVWLLDAGHDPSLCAQGDYSATLGPTQTGKIYCCQHSTASGGLR